jgi:hypothetical protein
MKIRNLSTSVVVLNAGEKIFPSILLFYFPPPKVVADLTYGHGRCWGDLLKHQTLDDKQYKVIKMDKVPQFPDVIKYDYTEKFPLEDKSVDVCFFDPPYLRDYGAFADDKENPDLQEHEVAGPRLYVPAEEIDRVTRMGVIVKIQDIHHEGVLIPQHILVYERLKPYFILKDIIIARYQRKATFKLRGFVRTVHCYYMIFKRNP